MGGRGARIGLIKRLPNHKKAQYPKNKFKNYLLNPTKDKNKAAFFKKLGYNMKNSNLLKSHIQAQLNTNNAVKYAPNKYGRSYYSVDMVLGISTKSKVTTCWVVDKGSNVPRFVTAYPARRAK